MSAKSIRFSPAILARLGEELIASPAQGLVELVKNAYDANARECVVELHGVDVVGGHVLISDDGDGMDESDIEDGWLLLGASRKEPSSPLPATSRVPSGSKGLGRLAAMRLGKSVSLESLPRRAPNDLFQLDIDWELYEGVPAVEDVDLFIKRRPAPKSRRAGTVVKLVDLKKPFGKAEVARLAKELVLLTDPFAATEAQGNAFRARLKSPEYTELEKLVENAYFDEAEYHLVASIDALGKASAEVFDYRGKRVFAAAHHEIDRSIEGKRVVGAGQPYRCPEMKFELHLFVLGRASFSGRETTIEEVKEWLNAFGGVRLYHRGIRVMPYGDAENDWLTLNLLKNKDPQLRPTTATSIGRIVTDDRAGQLQAKTDRSGLIENEAFHETRRFAIDVLEWLARKRIRERDQRLRAKKTVSANRAKNAASDLEKVAQQAPKKLRADIQNAVLSLQRAIEVETSALKEEVELYRSLATAGITTAMFAHESQKPLEQIPIMVDLLVTRARRHCAAVFDKHLADPLAQIREAAATVAAAATLPLGLLDRRKRRKQAVNVHEVITQSAALLRDFAERRRVSIKFSLDATNYAVFGTPASIESIVLNFFANSLYALEKVDASSRTIHVVTRNDPGEKLFVSVGDSGPGIRGIAVEDIWLPGQTTKQGGTGFGLTIVRDVVADLGGSVGVKENSILGGAEFSVLLPCIAGSIA
ncbi:MAG: ATP-binding protein [Planctomycetes bacterium]|nr:ATP-binding protein [Planctomycetota bacterium]